MQPSSITPERYQVGKRKACGESLASESCMDAMDIIRASLTVALLDWERDPRTVTVAPW